MSRPTQRFQQRLSKMSELDAMRAIRRQINNKLSILTSRYRHAKTNDQRVHILNQTEDLCIAEIDYWSNIVAIITNPAQSQDTVGSPKLENLTSFCIEEASCHISNFQNTIQNINKLRCELINK